MRKLQENKDAKFRSVQGVMADTNLSRYHVMQAAEEAKAVIRFGKRGIRVDTDLFFAHLRKEGSRSAK